MSRDSYRRNDDYGSYRREDNRSRFDDRRDRDRSGRSGYDRDRSGRRYEGGGDIIEGVCVKWLHDKGFGFIDYGEGVDVFCHAKNLNNDGGRDYLVTLEFLNRGRHRGNVVQR